MEGRDKRRWHTADEDKDGTLNKLEFKHFLHPEESDHMRDIVVSETLDDIDKDGDGLISLVIQLNVLDSWVDLLESIQDVNFNFDLGIQTQVEVSLMVVNGSLL